MIYNSDAPQKTKSQNNQIFVDLDTDIIIGLKMNSKNKENKTIKTELKQPLGEGFDIKNLNFEKILFPAINNSVLPNFKFICQDEHLSTHSHDYDYAKEYHTHSYAKIVTVTIMTTPKSTILILMLKIGTLIMQMK